MRLPSVLFVDDEVQLLNALRDLFRRDRKRWDMVFATGGAAALAEIERRRFDVVVADMRMPDVDGADLLRRVMESSPETARIVLSGHADSNALLRAAPVTHQFLGKPCDGDDLRTAVARAVDLRRSLENRAVGEILARMEEAPQALRRYWVWANAAAFEDPSTLDLTAMTHMNPMIADAVTKVGADGDWASVVASLRRPTTRFGLESRHGLVQAINMFSMIDEAPLPVRAALRSIRKDALSAARTARRLFSTRHRSDEAAVATMLRDVGKIVLAVALPDRFEAVVAEVAATGRRFEEIEAERFGATHAEVGARLLGVWGIPLSVVEAVALHHTPGLAANGDYDLLCAVHFADVATEAAKRGIDPTSPAAGFDLEFLNRAGCDERLPAWMEAATGALAYVSRPTPCGVAAPSDSGGDIDA